MSIFDTAFLLLQSQNDLKGPIYRKNRLNANDAIKR